MKKDVVSILDLTAQEILDLLDSAIAMKAAQKAGGHDPYLKGKTLAMIFEKPSLRTRVSFETGMFQLGGHAIYLAPTDIKMGGRESVADIARNLDRFCDVIMARVFQHSTVTELAKYSKVPVINGLCDEEHPCQALADLLTIKEKFGELKGRTVTFVGDGNNVAISLGLICVMTGANFRLANPEGYDMPSAYRTAIETEAKKTGAQTLFTHDPAEAATGAHVIYTDVWTSMGQEEETAKRKAVFPPFQINASLTALADPSHIIMHCLPAHRGEEITDEVIDGPHSVVFDQAENRMHAQKALLKALVAP